MAAAILVVLMALLLVAKAQTPGVSHLPTLLLGAARPEAGAKALTPRPDFTLTPKASAPWTPSGWGLFATAHGQSMDLAGPRRWAEDADARPDQLEAGFGWRGRNASATAGYVQPDFGTRDDDHPNSKRPSGLFGLTVTFHTPDRK